MPRRDCGPTIPSPPYAYACSNHHDVHLANEYTASEWKSFFALDTTHCKPSLMLLSDVKEAERMSHTFNPVRSFLALSSL